MSAIWHDTGAPSFLGIAPRFSFYELAEIHQEAPSPYEAAMREMKIREEFLGEEWFLHNAELSHRFWLANKPWWL